MPLEVGKFPDEVQVAFFVHQLLSDRWDGASGSYLGKDFNEFDDLINRFNIDDPKDVFLLVKRYDMHLINYRAEEQEKRRKKAEKEAASRGKDFTHNVKSDG